MCIGIHAAISPIKVQVAALIMHEINLTGWNRKYEPYALHQFWMWASTKTTYHAVQKDADGTSACINCCSDAIKLRSIISWEGMSYLVSKSYIIDNNFKSVRSSILDCKSLQYTPWLDASCNKDVRDRPLAQWNYSTMPCSVSIWE